MTNRRPVRRVRLRPSGFRTRLTYRTLASVCRKTLVWVAQRLQRCDKILFLPGFQRPRGTKLTASKSPERIPRSYTCTISHWYSGLTESHRTSIGKGNRTMAIATINPATGETIETFAPLSPAEIEKKLQLAVTAFRVERKTSFAERARRMTKAAEILERDKAKFAHLMTLELGKPYKAAVAEAAKCGTACRYYAENAERILADEVVETGAKKSFIRYLPIGPILAVMPWNFPFWQVIRFAAPALMAGNVGLLKHASNVPQCALAIEKIFREAGFDPGVFQTLLIENEAVERIIRDPIVKAVTLTGSERAGSAVASAAGREVKKSVLELGGSDPFIVMPSAKLEDAISTGVKSRMVNSGRVWIEARSVLMAE